MVSIQTKLKQKDFLSQLRPLLLISAEIKCKLTRLFENLYYEQGTVLLIISTETFHKDVTLSALNNGNLILRIKNLCSTTA